MTTYYAGPSPEQEDLEPEYERASQRYREAYEKRVRAEEARDNANRENPTPEEAAEYKQLVLAATRAVSWEAKAEERLSVLGQRTSEAFMKSRMIQYQAELTAKAVSKVLRAEMWWIKILLFVLVLLAAYEAHLLPGWLSKWL